MTQPIDDFDLNGFLPYRMAVAADRLSDSLAQRYRKEFGLSVAQWRVLVHVNDAGAVSIRDIHQRVNLEKSKASRAASKLEQDGLLIKEANPEDRRLIALKLTPKGHDLMARLLPMAAAYQKELETLLAPHLDALNAAITKIIDAD